MSSLSYLALGDSYTIGEQLPQQLSFPFLVQKKLHSMGMEILDPVVVAQTGWTTDELAAAIRERQLLGTYSIVSLLIGVNNQYRGRTLEDYERELSSLIPLAIQFADGDPRRVFIVSIPDWGATPFAEGKDRNQIAKEIDRYNLKKEEMALSMKTHFLSITESTREHGLNEEYLVEDGLHPNEKEYEIWADRLAETIYKALGDHA